MAQKEGCFMWSKEIFTPMSFNLNILLQHVISYSNSVVLFKFGQNYRAEGEVLNEK